MKMRTHILLASLIAVGCTGSTHVRPLHLPWWMTAGAEISTLLHLRQDVTFSNEGVRICRTLSNRSSRELVINRLLVGGSNRGQIWSWRFDAQGHMITRSLDGTHSPWQFPMIPAGPDDTRPFEVLRPGGQLKDCEMLEFPVGEVFQVISQYDSDLDQSSVPRHFMEGRTAIYNGQYVLSGVCVIRLRDRSAECTDERRWIAE